ncbi:MAG TPA: bifunctional hydroxymethylpyrimidine kinase/phosphomethylpyrimidine kinase [Acidimicrobiales bacterium]|nr:bifunctional hydroxymethylpyrimidine kinase/phosphomethylpyrimidine kinase [Acidimicrobiales bacterium]
MTAPNPPVALTIAGSDSGGGAGIQADLKTFAALGVFGTSAITAVTAQNTVEVRATHVVPPDIVDTQLSAVLDDLAPQAAKTGMLATAATLGVVGSRAAAGDLPPLVVDPVMVSSTGHRLLDEEAERAYLHVLLPFATVATPNLGEASILVGRDLHTIDDMAWAARRLRETGAGVVIIKGGHTPGTEAVDVVFDGQEVTCLRSPWVSTPNVHGTGCSLSAAAAAHLARGLPPLEAVARGKDFVGRALAGAAAWSLGSGHGPLDHFGWAG